MAYDSNNLRIPPLSSAVLAHVLFEAIEQNKQTKKIAKGSIYLALTLALALVKASRQAVFKQTSGKQKRKSKVGQQIQTNKSSNQTDQTNKFDKRQRFLLLRTTQTIKNKQETSRSELVRARMSAS